jgi:hypothetical protein
LGQPHGLCREPNRPGTPTEKTPRVPALKLQTVGDRQKSTDLVNLVLKITHGREPVTFDRPACSGPRITHTTGRTMSLTRPPESAPTHQTWKRAGELYRLLMPRYTHITGPAGLNATSSDPVIRMGQQTTGVSRPPRVNPEMHTHPELAGLNRSPSSHPERNNRHRAGRFNQPTRFPS